MDKWDRFVKTKKDSNSIEASCHGCPFGQVVSVSESVRYPEIYKNLPQFKDGKLWHDEIWPKKESGQCKVCFVSWLDDKVDQGKICLKCDLWIEKGQTGMVIESTFEYPDKTTYKTKKAVCQKCTLKIIESKRKEQACLKQQ